MNRKNNKVFKRKSNYFMGWEVMQLVQRDENERDILVSLWLYFFLVHSWWLKIAHEVAPFIEKTAIKLYDIKSLKSVKALIWHPCKLSETSKKKQHSCSLIILLLFPFFF